jgi:hypothetical protein
VIARLYVAPNLGASFPLFGYIIVKGEAARGGNLQRRHSSGAYIFLTLIEYFPMPLARL